MAAGTGYTGEDGVECAVPADVAAAFWQARARRRRRRRPGSGPATPCGSRPGCRCTATSWARASRPCRPGWAGWWDGTRVTSGAGPPLEREREPGPAAGCAGLVADGRQPPRRRRRRPAGRRAGRARSRAGTSRPCSDRGSPWPCSTPAAAIGDGSTRVVHRRPRPAARRPMSSTVAVRARRSERGAGVGEERVMSGYTPHTDAEIATMLAFLGLVVARRAVRRRPRRAAPGRRPRPARRDARARRARPHGATWPPTNRPGRTRPGVLRRGRGLRPRGPPGHPGPGRRGRSS